MTDENPCECGCAGWTLTVTDYTKTVNGKPLVMKYDLPPGDSGLKRVSEGIARAIKEEAMKKPLDVRAPQT